jgi:hypothetical protein
MNGGAGASQYGYGNNGGQNDGQNRGANYGANGGGENGGGSEEPASNLSCWTCVATSVEDCQGKNKTQNNLLKSF